MPSNFAFAPKQFPFYAYEGAIRPAGAAFMPSILLLHPSNIHFMLIRAHLGLRSGFYAQYFAFAAKQLPFYGYAIAFRPAGAAFMPSILLLQPSNIHFTLIRPHLGLRSCFYAQYYASESRYTIFIANCLSIILST